MKRLFVFIICLICLFGLVSCKNNREEILEQKLAEIKTIRGQAEYHPEFLDLILSFKETIDKDFLDYLERSDYKPVLHLNEYVIIADYDIRVIEEGSGIIYNILEVQYDLYYKKDNNPCWCGRHFLFKSKIKEDNNIVRGNFNTSHYPYQEDENGYNKSFSIGGEYDRTYGFCQYTKTQILEWYAEDRASNIYWDYEHFGSLQQVLVYNS